MTAKPYGPGNWPCPACGGHTAVTDSRPSDALGCHAVRRRRRCMADRSHRFTTYEVAESEVIDKTGDQRTLARAAGLARQLAQIFNGKDRADA